MNEKIYTKERMEDVYLERNLDEVNEEIKDLLENNYNIQEEVRKMKGEQEIQLIRLHKVMEQKDKAKVEIEGKNNKIQHLSL